MVPALRYFSNQIAGCYNSTFRIFSVRCKKPNVSLKIDHLCSLQIGVAVTTSPVIYNYLNRTRMIITQQQNRSISYDERQQRQHRRKVKLLFLMNCAINGAEKSGQWKKAVEWYDSFESRGLQPNTATFRMVISACENANEYGKVIELYSTMQSKGVEPDEDTNQAIKRALKMVEDNHQ